MISKTTRVENNKFYVDFDVKPKDLKHKRKWNSNDKGYTATHVGGGTTKRKGIKEGITIKSIKTKVGDAAWKTVTNANKITVSTGSNDVNLQISVTYTLKTMGWHHKDYTGTYPFFWFGNYNQVTHKYNVGKNSFKDSKPAYPGKEHTSCAVPSDWTLKDIAWSNWAYKHGQDTGNWEMSDGKYEKRNMNVDTSSQTTSKGWLSHSGYSQITRKSCMFTFEKTYTMSVKSSGIATKPKAPVLTVTAAKGDSGKISVKHIDSASKSGTIKVKATCKDKTVEVVSYTNSGTIAHNASKTFTIDFNKHFGESYRGNDIKYEAWTKNTLGYVSPSSGVKGGHRYNGRPSVSNMTSVNGSSNADILYDFVNFNWSKSTDPDNDTPTYELWLKVVDPNGKIVKDASIAKGISVVSYNKFDIRSYADNSTFEVKVRASDGQLTSDWSKVLRFVKGAKPRGQLAMIAPCISDSNLYNNRPRFFFEGYDGSSEFVFVYKDKEYTTVKHPHMFSTYGDKIVFKPDFNMARNTKFSCHVYMRNEYGSSKKSDTYSYTIKSPTENITEGDIVQATNVNKVHNLVSDFAKAYNKTYDTTIQQGWLVTAWSYNVCNDFLRSMANYLNSIVNTDTFDYNYNLQNVSAGQTNDDALWDSLVNELNNI